MRAAFLLALSLLFACDREQRRFSEEAARGMPANLPQVSGINAGERLPLDEVEHLSLPALPEAYQDNAWAVGEGARLFTWFNCAGCHGNGGGGSGPSLMDDVWRYGGSPQEVYASIVQGRPNGMPAFRGKIPDAQVWQLVAYVRGLGAKLRPDVEPGRADALMPHPVPAMMDHPGRSEPHAGDEQLVPLQEHSVLRAAGPAASTIEDLWWRFFSVCCVVFLVVVGLFGGALVARRELSTRARTRVVGAAMVVTIATLFVLLVWSLQAGHALAALGPNPSPMIEVTGEQWWWRVRYLDEDPAKIFSTANEIHIPTGQTITIRLRSADVIHSFWVPSLGGKADLIPGRDNTITLRADRAGLFRGQCAEFCGYQHAEMGFLVVAEEPARFEHWKQRQLEIPPPPDTPVTKRGMEVFTTGPCAMCHTVQGTSAAASAGPDLTHVAGRMTLAALAYPNNTDTLTAWLNGAQEMKPGAHMPSIKLAPTDQAAVAAWLETLR